MSAAKVNLHDGDKEVASVSVMVILKNNAKWLQYTLSKFQAMEAMYSCTFHYFFYENDSTDGTKELLHSFMQGRLGKLTSENGVAPYTNIGVNYSRTDGIAKLRNRLLNEMRPVQTDWTLMIDSGIYFKPENLGQMFKCKPAANNIVMVTPFSTEAFTGASLKLMAKSVDLPSNSENRVFSMNHYYDSFAFVDTNNKNYWPHCNFSHCKRCASIRGEHVSLVTIEKEQPIIKARSAYGGFAVIKSAILNNPVVKWNTLDLSDKYALCEHIHFCDTVTSSTGGNIVIDTDVNDVYWIN
jgi:hypothetical protein